MRSAGIVPYVPKPKRGSAASQGLFTKEEFRYDESADVYICPGDARLGTRYKRRIRDTVLIDYSYRAACKGCALKAQCINGISRKITRYGNEAVLERMAERLAGRPEILDQRRTSVEHPFGSIKQWMGQGLSQCAGSKTSAPNSASPRLPTICVGPSRWWVSQL